MSEYARLVLSVDSSQASQSVGVLNRLDDASRKVETSSRNASRSVSSLGSSMMRLAGPLAAFLSARSIIQASDQYGQMASRIKMATSSAAEYLVVQERLLATANATYRPLAEAQEVYLRTADAIRSLGYETSEVLDITDSFSFLLVTNAASAERGASAINAYSKAIQTGKVDSESWQSILAAMPTVVDDIAAATGRSTAEIRKLGVEGKLSVTALNEALRQSMEQNKELAANMETSVGDAMTALGNSFQVFVGKVNETSKASGMLTESVGELADVLQDPKVIQAAQDMAAGVVNAFSAIAKGISETVGVVRWGAEEIAARLHGAAGDDIVRLENEVQRWQELQDSFFASPTRMRVNGDGIQWWSDAEIDQNLKLWSDKLEQARKTQEQSILESTPKPPSPTADTGEQQKRINALVEAEAPAVQRATKARAAKRTEVELLLERQQQYVSGLEREAATAGKTAAEVRQYEIAEKGLAGAMLERAQAAAQVIDAIEAETEARRKQDELNSEAKGVMDALRTEEEAIRASYEKRREIILSSTIGTAEERAEALLRLENQTNEELLAINGSYWERWLASAENSLTNFDDLAGEVVKNFSTQFGDAFEAMIFDSQSLGDAVGNMAEGMARSVVNALGQMAAQWLAYQAVQLLVGKTAQSSAATSMAATASATAIQAGLNAFASTAAIPIVGPAAAPAAMAAALAVTTPMAASVSALAMAGMAHDGIDSIPREGTWLLDKGERVVDSRTNQDLKRYLQGQQASNEPATTGGRSTTINQTIQTTGRIDRRTASQLAQDSARSTRQAQSRLG